jgi:microcystin degradation protein MlrC
MRVGVLGLMHESNSFLAQPTTWDDFQRDVVVAGPDVASFFRDAHHEMNGFFTGLAEAGIEAAPIFFARANPWGPISTATCDRLLAMMLEQLHRAGPLDGLLLAPHGAAVGEREPDLDGHWLGVVRGAVGPALPMINTLDLHANVSPGMIEACHATIPYRSNPHLDQRARGQQAARLMVDTLQGRVRPTQAAALPAMIINIERQRTDEPHCRAMYQMLARQESRDGALASGVTLGFPYSDVAEMGSAFIAVTNDDPGLAQRLATEAAAWLLERREQFVGELIEPDEAVRGARQAARPVCLLDMGDNVGGGSPGDGVVLARAALAAGDLKTFLLLWDPAAVAAAKQGGAGATLTLDLGGRSDACYGPPLRQTLRVVGLYDGQVREQTPVHAGFTHFDMGPTAVLANDRLTVLATTHRTYPASLNQLTACGLDPASFDVLLAKGVHAPVGAYQRVCRTFIRVNTPGSTGADLSQVTYRRRRRPLFPLEAIDADAMMLAMGAGTTRKPTPAARSAR